MNETGTNPKDELIELVDAFSELFDNAPFGYIIHDKFGNIRRVNLTAARLFGKSRNNLEGYPLTSFVKKEDKGMMLDYFAGLKNSAGSGEIVFRAKKYDELVYLKMKTVYSGSGVFGGDYRSALLDVTESRLREELLKSNEERFKYLAESSPVLIWLAGPNRMCHYFNKTYQDFTGRYSRELFGTRWITYVHPDDRKKVTDEFDKAFESSATFSCEYRMLRHDGQYRWIQERAAPFFINSKEHFGYIGVGIDITDDKMNKEFLVRSNEEKQLYIKEMHHRIKNNLQTVISIINLHNCSREEDSPVFEEIQNRIKAIAGIHDFLMTSGNISSINIKDFCNELIRRIRLTHSPGVNIDLTAESIVIDQKAAMDIGLIVNEIITNAYKHAFTSEKEGNITVSVGKSTAMLEIVIHDNGCGFNPGWRENSKGSFGFLMIQSLMKRYDGILNIENDNGTKFLITLPFKNIQNSST